MGINRENNTLSVLIVESSITYLQALRRVCLENSYDVICASSGDEAMDLLDSNNPDIIILSFSLPDHNGNIIAKNIRKHPNFFNTPIMILTIGSNEEDISHGLNTCADVYVSKDEDFDVIISRINSLHALSTASADLLNTGEVIYDEEEIKLVDQKILIVDDNITYLQALRRNLIDKGYIVLAASSGEECFEVLQNNKPDLLLLDLKMPVIDGSDVCRMLRKSAIFHSLPIIMLTASDSQEDIVRAFEVGVNDYVVKSSNFATMNIRIASMLKRRQSEKENLKIRNKIILAEEQALRATLEKDAQKQLSLLLEDQKAQLYQQANYDILTTLPNRTLFNDRLEQAIRKSRRTSSSFALFFIDLDRFKQINDSLGHKFGDEVLKIVATRFLNIMRSSDTVARIGGDEFTVIIDDISAMDMGIATVAQKIINSLISPIIVEGENLYVGASIGIALYPENGDSSTLLTKNADAAMYKAKESGRSRYQFYNQEMTDQVLNRLQLEHDLRNAIINDEFVVYYQPQVNGNTGKLIGMEALVRWKKNGNELVPPFNFIPFAEEIGLIITIDEIVMNKAMTQISNWYKKGYSPGKISINLAIKQLYQDDFVPLFKKMISATDCHEDWVELEITESEIMKNPERAIEKLKQISDMGVEIAIDDFGTGYSSLAYLKRLPINKLKIDKSFIDDIDTDDDDIIITNAVIGLTKSMNLGVIAEGVEKEIQKNILIANGCDNIQGYFYGKPMPASEMEAFIIESAKK